MGIDTSTLVAAYSDVASREQDFYAQKSYGERVADGVGKLLGLAHVTPLDVVILVPLIPGLAILISWWLPWERLLWRMPKMISGPYFLYCALVLWHFRARWWMIAVLALLGVALGCLAIRERVRPWRRDQ